MYLPKFLKEWPHVMEKIIIGQIIFGDLLQFLVSCYISRYSYILFPKAPICAKLKYDESDLNCNANSQLYIYI